MFTLLAMLAELLVYAGVYELATSVDPPRTPRANNTQPIRSRVTDLEKELDTVRRLASEHGLAVRIKAEARKRMFMEISDEVHAGEVCMLHLRRPLAELIRAGHVRPGDTVTVASIEDGVTLSTG